MTPGALPTFQRLLVPLDGSRLAEATLPAAERLARQFGATITLLHVLEQRPPTTIHGDRHLTASQEALAYLDTVAARLRADGLTVETHVHENREGDVARSLAQHAYEVHADLVLPCTHGSGGVRNLLFGRVALKVLQRGTCPVLLIPPAQPNRAPSFEVQRIVGTLEGAPDQDPVLPFALGLARAFGAALHLLLVVPTIDTLKGGRAMSGMLLPTTMRALLDLALQDADTYLTQVVAAAQSQGVTVTAEAARGDPAPLVLDYAARVNADLIVLASYGRAGLDALLSGGVAARLADRAACPLLLVRVNKARFT